jgi:hypothetical protein
MADVVIKKHKGKKRGKPVVVEFVDPALEDRKVRERKKVCEILTLLINRKTDASHTRRENARGKENKRQKRTDEKKKRQIRMRKRYGCL